MITNSKKNGITVIAPNPNQTNPVQTNSIQSMDGYNPGPTLAGMEGDRRWEKGRERLGGTFSLPLRLDTDHGYSPASGLQYM